LFDRRKTIQIYLQTLIFTVMSTLKNKVVLVGRLGAKPEETVFSSGNKKVRFNLAVSESFKNKAGEWVNNTEWHTITAWGKVVDRVMKVMDKGMEVMIEGKLIHNQYETADGQKRSSTEVVINDFMLFGAKK
jgi:single-strand DNA-binding protein